MSTIEHDHEIEVIFDPITGHEWEICSCGYSNDITVLRGESA